ncbi:MAG: osmoprotectant NAGGN system M42 family peptidase [Proteobacteria bacterium]|nr:osmoprotectant NAGGN system M42 family peptidase [Pseudomonadota bacterium]
MENAKIDNDYLTSILLSLLNIHSPSGYSDQIVHYVGKELKKLKIDFNVTRRGAIRASLKGVTNAFDRAITVHLDTIGAMVSELKENGRLAIVPIGTWSSRFAEGSRVTIFTEKSPYRGTVLPLKASGHVFDSEIDTQETSWKSLEIRVDEICPNKTHLLKKGFDIGDFISFDTMPEITDNVFINARHLDDKAGVAILLSIIKAIRQHEIEIPVDCHFLFTIFEEVGSGASSVLYEDVNEMIVLDHAPVAPGQNSTEFSVTIGMMDQTGPYDYHLNRKLVDLCKKYKIDYRKDIFRFYRSDSASAIEAGNDTRTALVGFGVDGSHGYERTHISSLIATANLILLYIQSDPVFKRDRKTMSSLEGFPNQPGRKIIQIKT